MYTFIELIRKYKNRPFIKEKDFEFFKLVFKSLTTKD